MNKTDTAILAARNAIIREEIAALHRGFVQPHQPSFEIRNVLALDTLSASVNRPVFGRRDSRLR